MYQVSELQSMWHQFWETLQSMVLQRAGHDWGLHWADWTLRGLRGERALGPHACAVHGQASPPHCPRNAGGGPLRLQWRPAACWPLSPCLAREFWLWLWSASPPWLCHLWPSSLKSLSFLHTPSPLGRFLWAQVNDSHPSAPRPGAQIVCSPHLACHA